MRIIKKKILQAKREGKLKKDFNDEDDCADEGEEKKNEAAKDGKKSLPKFEESLFDPMGKIAADKPLSDSEQEEIDEQLTGNNTTR